MPQPVLLNEKREELLREILRRMGRVALSSHIRIQRKPIDSSEVFQRPLPPIVRMGTAGSQHDAPSRRDKARMRVPVGGSGGRHDEPLLHFAVARLATMTETLSAGTPFRGDVYPFRTTR